MQQPGGPSGLLGRPATYAAAQSAMGIGLPHIARQLGFTTPSALLASRPRNVPLLKGFPLYFGQATLLAGAPGAGKVRGLRALLN